MVDIGISDGFQSTKHGKEGGNGQQNEGRGPHGNTKDLTDENASCKKRQRKPGDEYGDNGVPSEDIARLLTETKTHEFRQGTHITAEISGSKDKGQ